MLPKDPFILLSYINTKLRDDYPSLDELCKALGVENQKLTETLDAIGYTYDVEANQFR